MSYYCNYCKRDVTACAHKCARCHVNGVHPDQRLCSVCIGALRLAGDTELWEAMKTTDA